MDNSVFVNLVDPISPESFFDKYWDKTYLFIERKDAFYYNHILNDNDINNMFARKDLFLSLFRVYLNEKIVPPTEYQDLARNPELLLIDTDKLLHLFNIGATIIIEKGNLLFTNLFNLCQSLEAIVGVKVNANIYITPPDAKGFKPHYDTHDAFILQISGTKRWDIYNEAFFLPLANQIFDEEVWKVNFDLLNFETKELTAGDLIYLPRGYVHSTNTDASSSIHATVSFNPYKNIDIFRLIVLKAEGKEAFRKNMPCTLSSDDEKKFFTNNVKSLMKTFIDEVSIDVLIDEMQKSFVKRRMANSFNRFRDMQSSSKIGLNTVVRYANNLWEIEIGEDTLQLMLGSKKISLPSSLRSIITKLRDSPSLKASEIDNELDNDSKIILVSQLIKEGFLTIVENET